MFAIGLALGALICGLPMVVNHADWPPLIMTVVALAICAAGLGLARPEARWITGLGVGFSVFAVVVVQITLDMSRDPTSHNLFPFEIVIAILHGLPPALIGAFLGAFLGGRLPKRTQIGALAVVLALAVPSIATTARAIEIAANEASVLEKVKVLIAAQREFRRTHPDRGYTCDLGDLGQVFVGQIEHYSDRTGTGAVAHTYNFSLKCFRKPYPQRAFALRVGPDDYSDPRGYLAFCADQSGVIRSIPFRKIRSCFVKGEIVR